MFTHILTKGKNCNASTCVKYQRKEMEFLLFTFGTHVLAILNYIMCISRREIYAILAIRMQFVYSSVRHLNYSKFHSEFYEITCTFRPLL